MTYTTVASVAEGLYKEKGSKFLSFIIPVETEAEFKSEVEKLRMEHKNAVHFCTGVRIGFPDVLERPNDDGEPSGSAGKPILNQLISNNLTNCGIVVVRYYGGTKLGVSGLIAAYKLSAADAIVNCSIVEKEIKAHYLLHFPYELTGEIQSVLNSFQAEIITKSFDDLSHFTVSISLNEIERFEQIANNFHLINIDKIDT